MNSVIPHFCIREMTSAVGASGYLTIDLGGLRRNYEKLSASVSPAKAAAVIKADAYGLGATKVAATLFAAGCRHFFVAHFCEATEIKPHLSEEARIFVLNGLQPGNEPPAAEAGIIPVLNSMEQLHRWTATARALSHRLPAVLQFDTGMSRLGFPPEERALLAEELRNNQDIEILFIMSHLASADDADSQQNGDQLSEMRQIAEEFPAFSVCFANSGGVFLGSEYHGTLVRPGIVLYGGAPNNGGTNSMEPVVRLDVAVIQTRTVPAEARVGYGATHVTKTEARLATLAAGYADGLPRSLSDRGAVYYNGVRLPIVGRVSMDSITIDISALPAGTLSLGSLVEVIGPSQTLEMLAADAGTISYEMLTSLGHRYRRQYR
ncbi:alanine racemase (plasmid) [Aminobacter sp. SR38]|jgi:alanine racemase|uniref:alanine racemase n=1 Tax=Hyphomicrobiales TaxID=356 RepID=UPI00177F6235|nr:MULTISPECIES: alanine racemase [Hyphomicrobiales]MCZ7497396.1 alanine racemase [Rhizobium rhizogenes]MCZ7501889.1 alanine racemase [Rhizobium rhizogenes]QOF75324.1 alanine racemase [Aminobacter sp. SR38]